MKPIDQVLLAWLALTSAFAFVLFGYDKFRSARPGARVAEFHLALAGAIGGWPGGLLAMLVFRHKTAKLSFQIKYAFAFLIWAGLVYLCFRWR